MSTLGEYTAIGKHKDCKYNGTVYHITDPVRGLDYLWCRGSVWDGIEKVWKHCGASTSKGDVIEIGDDKSVVKPVVYTDIQGLPIDEAIELAESIGMKVRTVCVDGKSCFVTCDVRLDRINVEVTNQIVTKIRNIG